MPLLDAAFVAERLLVINSRWAANMDALASVLPASVASGSEGAEHELTWPDAYAMGFDPTDFTQYPCRIQLATPPTEGTDADQERAKAWWRIAIADLSARLNPTDRLWIEGRDAVGGAYSRLIQVTGPEGPRTWQAVLTVLGWQILPPADGLD